MKEKLLNAPILSMRDIKEIVGTIDVVVPMVREDGSPVLNKHDHQLHTVELASDTGEVTKLWADAGLRGDLTISRVKPGMKIRIKHVGTIKHPEHGTELQKHEIFGLN